MMLILKFLVAATLMQLSVAISGTASPTSGFPKSRKYHLSREPPVKVRSAINDEEIVEEKWIEQSLNHFDPQDDRTWPMRYMENNFFLQDGGPIFIFVGGEWMISEGWLLSSHFHDMARDLNGTMFYTEHRYYGASWPTEDVSDENLRFLTIDQALADLAHFIKHVKRTIPEVRNSGVILVGASYSATMVTWFMQKYPHLANGAWSSSAPIEAKVDFVEFKEVVSEAIESVGGSSCSSRIRNAFAELDSLIESGNTDRIEELFQFCYPLDVSNQLDVWTFMTDVAETFTIIVQYHSQAFELIAFECEDLTADPDMNDLDAMAQWLVGPDEPGNMCYSHRYSDTVSMYNGTGWFDFGPLLGMRQWTYQTCTEFGWFQTSSGSERSLFGSNIPVDLSLQLCKDLHNGIFTPEIVDRHINRTNIIYGALNPNARNVYSTNGRLDPWAAMGVQEDINEDSPTVIFPHESHVSDLYSISDWDSPELIASKERIFELVQVWLGISGSETTLEPTEGTDSTPVPEV